jgi:hypothetical protein
MQNDIIDRSDLYRLADDGCPNVPDRDTGTQDLSELWADPGKDDHATV